MCGMFLTKVSEVGYIVFEVRTEVVFCVFIIDTLSGFQLTVVE